MKRIIQDGLTIASNSVSMKNLPNVALVVNQDANRDIERRGLSMANLPKTTGSSGQSPQQSSSEQQGGTSKVK